MVEQKKKMTMPKTMTELYNIFDKGKEDIYGYLQKINEEGKIEGFTRNVFKNLNNRSKENINNTTENVASIVRNFYYENDIETHNYEKNDTINIDINTDNKYAKVKFDENDSDYHFVKIIRETIFNYYVSFIAKIDKDNEVIDIKYII